MSTSSTANRENNRNANMPGLYFLHIGKTGGSYTSPTLKWLANRADLDMTFGAHKLRFGPMVRTQPLRQAIFGIRDPIDIFVSGFYSRQRKGAPKYYAEWSPDEKRAFSTFTTANQLAEALGSEDLELRSAAEDAMTSIQHVRRALCHYLKGPAFVRQHRDKVFFILDQPTLDSDLDALFARFNLQVPARLRNDEEKKHKNPEGVDKSLSEVARRNLEEFYQKDIRTYQICRGIREDILSRV